MAVSTNLAYVLRIITLEVPMAPDVQPRAHRANSNSGLHRLPGILRRLKFHCPSTPVVEKDHWEHCFGRFRS